MSGQDAEARCCCDGRGWTLTDDRVNVCDCGVYDPPQWVLRGDPACVIPHVREPERPRRAGVGRLCAGCYHHLEQVIAELPAYHSALVSMLAPTTGRGGRVSGTPEDRLPILVTANARVGPAADHRDHIVGVLASWVRLVLEERNQADRRVYEARLAVWRSMGADLPCPVFTPWRPPSRVSPDGTAAWLLAHLRWAAGAGWVGDLVAEMHALRGRAKRILYPPSRRRVQVGPCGQCPGLLWLAGDVDEGQRMGCDGCGRVVEPRYWRAEASRVDGVAVNPWLPLDLAAVHWGVSVRTLQRWVVSGRLEELGGMVRAVDVTRRLTA